MKKYFLLFLLCILSLGALSFVFLKKHSHINVETDEIPILATHTLKNHSFTYIKSFIGSVEAIKSVAILPYISAFLKEVRIHAGEEVMKGETLFLLDDKIQLANLNQAKEAVKQSLAKLENAKIYYNRMKNTDKKAISPTELEQAKTDYDAAMATYQKAIASENQAQTMYDYTIIQAPISGWVGNITATIGEYLSPESKPLATIVSFSPIRLTFSIPMSEYKGDNWQNTDAVLQVILPNGYVLEFKNFIISRDNQADKSTDSLSFFIDVPNDKKFLIPGEYVELRFLYSETGILVNKNWITLTSDGAETTILKNGLIEKQKVEIGAPVGFQYWIKSGLNEGDNIITTPVSPFQIGQPAKGIDQ